MPKNPIFAVRLKKKQSAVNLKILVGWKYIWFIKPSLLNQLYEQNILEWANSEGVTFQVG